MLFTGFTTNQHGLAGQLVGRCPLIYSLPLLYAYGLENGFMHTNICAGYNIPSDSETRRSHLSLVLFSSGLPSSLCAPTSRQPPFLFIDSWNYSRERLMPNTSLLSLDPVGSKLGSYTTSRIFGRPKTLTMAPLW